MKKRKSAGAWLAAFVAGAAILWLSIRRKRKGSCGL